MRRTAAVGLVLGLALVGRGDPGRCLTLHDLQRMSECELADLYGRSEVGTPPVGKAKGKVMCLTDRRPRLKAAMQNAVWKGKMLEEDGSFVNRWVGGVKAIHSCYVIGPSWVDGRPAVVMEYAPGTPVLANTRDELREVAPGLYLGPLFDRYPCPKFRGYVALQIQPCR